MVIIKMYRWATASANPQTPPLPQRWPLQTRAQVWGAYTTKCQFVNWQSITHTIAAIINEDLSHLRLGLARMRARNRMHTPYCKCERWGGVVSQALKTWPPKGPLQVSQRESPWGAATSSRAGGGSGRGPALQTRKLAARAAG